MIRSLLARRPLLVHTTFGAAASAGMYFTQPEPYNNDDDDDDDGDDSTVADIAARAVIGGLMGGAMRFWYPAIERIAHQRFASPVVRTASKIIMDATPAFLWTFGRHYSLRWYYERQYGALASDPWSLSARIEDAVKAAVEGAAVPFDAEEIDVISSIISSRPTSANAITAAISVANFIAVPRQFRGLVGTLQWLIFDASAQETDVEVVEVGLPTDDDGDHDFDDNVDK